MAEQNCIRVEADPPTQVPGRCPRCRQRTLAIQGDRWVCEGMGCHVLTGPGPDVRRSYGRRRGRGY